MNEEQRYQHHLKATLTVANLSDTDLLRTMAANLRQEFREHGAGEVYAGDGSPLGCIYADVVETIATRIEAIAERLEGMK